MSTRAGRGVTEGFSRMNKDWTSHTGNLSQRPASLGTGLSFPLKIETLQLKHAKAFYRRTNISWAFEEIAYYNNCLPKKKSLTLHFDKGRLISCTKQDWIILRVL